MTQRVRVQNFGVSRDGIGAGADQSFEHPFGHVGAGPMDPGDLFAWAAETASWVHRGESGGTRGIEDYIQRDYARGIGAEIMGRNKFGPVRGPWPDLEWEGWWGEEPPFHTPVVVLTHHPRPRLVKGETTFHFIDASPQQALQEAKAAADGQDVRIGGGVTTLREFLEADLIDEMHVAMVPFDLGTGLRLWQSPEELTDRFHLEKIPAPSGVTHHFFWRR